MRVVVDLNRCQGYAQCCYAAPEYFEVRGHEILFYDPAPPETKRSQIERAQHARSGPSRSSPPGSPRVTNRDG